MLLHLQTWPDIDAYLWHEHYTWNSARPRARNSTLEIRPGFRFNVVVTKDLTFTKPYQAFDYSLQE